MRKYFLGKTDREVKLGSTISASGKKMMRK